MSTVTNTSSFRLRCAKRKGKWPSSTPSSLLTELELSFGLTFKRWRVFQLKDSEIGGNLKSPERIYDTGG